MLLCQLRDEGIQFHFCGLLLFLFFLVFLSFTGLLTSCCSLQRFWTKLAVASLAEAEI